MSRTILIYGQSGAGKTTSCRNLDPKSTFFIDADGKGLSWRGWKKSFNVNCKNYFRTDELDPKKKNSVPFIFRTIATSDAFSHIKTIVIDGITTLMVTDEFRRQDERSSYDKYRDMAKSIFELCKEAVTYREDLTVIFIGHVDPGDDADPVACVKTSGRKIKKIVLESLFTTVLYAKTDGLKYWFETTSNNSTAKSPMGALSPIVDNDINDIIEQLIAYEEDPNA